MQVKDSYWWYITIKACADEEEILFSLADISGSIGTESQELPDGQSRLRMYYRSNEELAHWKDLLLGAMKEFPQVEIEDSGKIDNQPWHVAAQDAFPPLPVGTGLVVLAPWHKGTEPEGRTPLYINPGSAFGTGYHESTQIVLELMEKYIREGMTTADIGTGSGILTIGALKLGAKKAYARDIDPAVIEEVRSNLALNDLSDANTDLAVGDLLRDFGHKAELLTANILIEPNCQLVHDVPAVIGKNGVALFSGMLEKEKPQFLAALKEAGMEPVEELVKGEWWGVAAKAKA
ncbi:MAG: 50S ribosomal protein L11 methyltransferase [Cloacibacillus sp.]